MARIIKNLMEVAGIAEHIPANLICFRQYDFTVQFLLPGEKPAIRQVIKVAAEISISCTRVVRTPVATSLEGQVLTGFKLIVEGDLQQRIEYVADVPSQAIYALHQASPFCSYIVLPRNYSLGIPVSVTPYIEDISADLVDPRCIQENISVLLDTDL